MTRKSQARVERDIKEQKAQEALRNNTCWDDLNVISADAVMLMQKHVMIAGLLRNKDLNGFLPNVESVVANAKLLDKDVKALTADLEGLKALHADKTGGTDDPDVVMHTIGIFEQYQLFLERHEQIIMPTVSAILEQYNQAETRLNVAIEAGRQAQAELAEAPFAQGATDIVDAELVEDDKASDLANESRNAADGDQ